MGDNFKNYLIMAKKLKYWNGRGQGHKCKGHVYVAAYSEKQAVEIIKEAFNSNTTISEIRNYFSNCWGSPMKGIEPKYPSVYYDEEKGTPPYLVLEATPNN